MDCGVSNVMFIWVTAAVLDGVFVWMDALSKVSIEVRYDNGVGAIGIDLEICLN